MQIDANELKVIHSDDGRILTGLFRKATWSGRYLNYNSHLPLAYKRNTVSLMTKKILRLSDSEFHERNFLQLRETLLANSYPLRFFDKILNETCTTFMSTKNLMSYVNDPSLKFMSIPYVPSIFEKFKFFSGNITSQGSDEKSVQSGVVYQVSCLSCTQI
jgi:hypothetical protein